MEKDYKKWHPLKAHINNSEDKRPYFHEREIWFCHIGENIGFEQDGRGDEFLRPIIILRKFNNEVFWGIPLTRTEKRSKHYYTFTFNENRLSTAVLSQIRLSDAKRLGYKIGEISQENFAELKKRLKALLP